MFASDSESSTFSIKLYSHQKEQISEVQRSLRKQIPAFSFFRLPSVNRKYTIRISPGGKGFSTFKKYSLKLHKALICFKNLKDLKKALSLTKMVNLFSEVNIV